MQVVIRDGWPVVFPYLFVEGLHANHLTVEGYVCLWHEGDGSREWVTLEGIFQRLTQWSRDAREGWDPTGLARDAQLNFAKKLGVVATFDISKLQLGAPGSWGYFYGELRHERHVVVRPGRRPSHDLLDGLWFRTGQLEVPPRNLTELRGALNRSQAHGLARALDHRAKGELLKPSGSTDLILLTWDRDHTPYVLAIAVEGTGASTVAYALQPGPVDEESLLLRAGPDASQLRDKSVTIFGLGALGGYVALSLAESGVGRIVLVDGEQLLPENNVRHAAGRLLVGASKPAAVAMIISEHAPWTKTREVDFDLITPSAIAQAISDVDLVIDTTGGDAATQAICLSAARLSKKVVSGALYRGGAVARVRRQGAPGDVPILERTPVIGYAFIPPGSGEDLVQPAVGCSGPVHNAPPVTVLAAAALVSGFAIDLLMERLVYPDEVIEVYRPLVGEPPFDKLGRIPAVDSARLASIVVSST